MPDHPTADEPAAWHRRFAAQANNRAWDLSERAELTAEERQELLYAAYGAAYHWSKVGNPGQIAQAELLLGHVHALLGHGDLAMQFARSAFEGLTAGESAGWERAFAHAILAHAAAASGDVGLHREHYQTASRAGEALTDPEEKALFLTTFTRIPSPGV